MSSADNIAHLLNLRGADSTALSKEISDRFGGGNPEEEVLSIFTLLSELARVIKIHNMSR